MKGIKVEGNAVKNRKRTLEFTDVVGIVHASNARSKYVRHTYWAVTQSSYERLCSLFYRDEAKANDWHTVRVNGRSRGTRFTMKDAFLFAHNELTYYPRNTVQILQTWDGKSVVTLAPSTDERCEP